MKARHGDHGAELSFSVFSLLLAFLLGACDRPRVTQTRPPPELSALEVVSVIQASDSFRFAGVAPSGNCRIWGSGFDWGLIVDIDLRSGKVREVGQLPGWLSRVHLEPGSGHTILAWSSGNQGRAMRLNTRTEAVQILDLPGHAWGGSPAVGPMTKIGDSVIAMAPLGATPSTKSPRPWVEVPLIWILTETGKLTQPLDRIGDRGGEYLSAHAAQTSLGSRGDTLVAVSLVDAKITTYAPSTNGSSWRVLGTVELPRYFDAPSAWEDIWRPSWLTEQGDQPRVYSAPHLSAATVGTNGYVYVVRNGGARWNPDESAVGRAVYERAGNWWITRQWIEVYTLRGILVGSYTLPADYVSWLRTDDAGHMFFRVGDGSIIVTRNPTRVINNCQGGPAKILVDAIDSPYGHQILPITGSPKE